MRALDFVNATRLDAPLALVSGLLCLLQLGQSRGQTLLSAIQLLLNQLDTPVKGSDISLSLRRDTERGSGDCGGQHLQHKPLEITHTYMSAQRIYSRVDATVDFNREENVLLFDQLLLSY